MPITIMLQMRVALDNNEFVRERVESVLPATRLEVGCIRSDIMVDNDDPSHIVCIEQWECFSNWQRHMTNRYVINVLNEIQPVLKQFEVREMTVGA